MSVSNLTNGCKKAILELAETDIVDLIGACQSRMAALDLLLSRTHDVEDRERLETRRQRTKAMLNRLVAL